MYVCMYVCREVFICTVHNNDDQSRFSFRLPIHIAISTYGADSSVPQA